MNWAEFLQSFEDISDDALHRLRRTERLTEWPTDGEYYLAIAREMFPHERTAWEQRQRLVSIFREMVYTDGRTLDALLYIADVAADDPECFDGNGINALAGVWCFLRARNPAEFSHLLPRFSRLAGTSALAHNAKRCVEAVSPSE